MSISTSSMRFLLIFVLFSMANFHVFSQVNFVGSGSYTTLFPGPDAANRNTVPSGTPRLSGAASSMPVASSDWWTGLLTTTSANLYNYPLSMRALNNGLVISHTFLGTGVNDTRQPMGPEQPVVVSVVGMGAVTPTVSNHTDWTVTANWTDGSRSLSAIMGVGMPFVYFTKGASDIASVTVNIGTATINGEMILVTNSIGGVNFAIYAPSGSTWTRVGNNFTSGLNGHNYFSVALLPSGINATTAANDFRSFAYVFPVNTSTSWSFDSSTSIVRTTFSVTPQVMEGTGTTVLLGLLPHQWSRLAPGSQQPGIFSYNTVRGSLRMLASNSFVVENHFRGILPTMPNTAKYSAGFNPGELYSHINLVRGEALAEWTDSYNDGLLMNRMVQVAHIAHQQGHIAARDQILNTVRARLEDWLSFEAGERAFLLHYHTGWTALIPYPAGHGADGNLNDHHFHYGYFISAAAAIEKYQPGWAANWGGMVNLLVRNTANTDRACTKFPFLRTFNPYMGHSWASGLLRDAPHGNNQESSSEAMNFNAALIHWGAVTGNTAVRDLGIYLYTTEQSAIEEYWFDIHDRNLPTNYGHPIIARLWGNGVDRNTWWTPDIAAMYGIQMVPLTASSLYWAHNPAYLNTMWNAMTTNTGVLQNVNNVNLWYDVYWPFRALSNPQHAITLHDNFPNRSIKFGESAANTYNWIHALNGVGILDPSITANHPFAVVFNKSGVKTYVAHNYSASPITVQFTDGFSMTIPARTMLTSRDVDVQGTLTASSTQLPRNGTVTLTAEVSGAVTRVEFFNGGTLLATSTTAPHSFTTAALPLGRHNFFIRVYSGDNFNLSNVVSVIVGSQMPYLGSAWPIPGVLEGGNYDFFEGGLGQGISYHDVNTWNEAGSFRSPEGVDAAPTASEGNTVGWIAGGEWLEYTVNIATAGTYSLSVRYASGVATGGGPFRIEVNGDVVVGNITVPTTGNWGSWATRVIPGVVLPAGTHVLRYFFENGGFNLGRTTFTLDGPTSLENNTELTSIEVYPLPMGNVLNVVLGSGSFNWLIIKDITGRIVIRQAVDDEAGIVRVDVSQLPNGIYLLNVMGQNSSQVRKLVKK